MFNPTLSYVNVGENAIGDDGAAAVIDAALRPRRNFDGSWKYNEAERRGGFNYVLPRHRTHFREPSFLES